MHFWPGPAGGKEWTHMAYSPKTGLIYVPVQEVGATATRRRREFKESIPYWGAGVAVDLDDHYGFVAAIDPLTGEEKWRWRNEYPMCASTLTTAGGLVFQGTPTGEFVALDERDRREALVVPVRQRAPQQPLTSYSIDGRQYIAVPTGWGGWVEGFLPGLLGAAAGDALFVLRPARVAAKIHRTPTPEDSAVRGGHDMELRTSGRRPQFEEIGVAPEVTMYVAQMDD